MHLDSVRELKQSLASATLAPAALERRIRAMGVAAKPLAAVTHPRTVALGIAPRKKADFALAVRIQHRALGKSDLVETIRRKAAGEVDVRYIGRVVTHIVPWHQRENRPLRIGGSVGHFKITAGTLGCFVRGRGDGDGGVFILSNNHVLATENRAKRGDNVLQPGASDGGVNPDNAVARLHKFVRLSKTKMNEADCAIALVDERVDCLPTKLLGLGKFAGLGSPVTGGERLAKVGRTTGLTRGRVTAFEVDDVVVDYDTGELGFNNQVEIEGTDNEPFSQGGDSGSMIVNAERCAVALLFAGSDLGGSDGQGLTYANPMQTVLSALKVEVIS